MDDSELISCSGQSSHETEAETQFNQYANYSVPRAMLSWTQHNEQCDARKDQGGEEGAQRPPRPNHYERVDLDTGIHHVQEVPRRVWLKHLITLAVVVALIALVVVAGARAKGGIACSTGVCQREP